MLVVSVQRYCLRGVDRIAERSVPTCRVSKCPGAPRRGRDEITNGRPKCETLRNDEDDEDFWANELHPTTTGFSLVTDKFASVISKLP